MRLIVIFLAVFISNVCFAADKIVCVVNDQIITESEMNEFMNVLRFKISMQYKDPDIAYRMFEKEKVGVLEKIIEDRLITQAAQEKGYEIPEGLIEERIDEFRSQFKTEQEFEETLVTKGINIKSLRKKVVDQILMRQIVNDEVRSKIKIKPYQVTDYYKANMNSFVDDAGLNYKAIVLEDEEKAVDVYDMLVKTFDHEAIIKGFKESTKDGSVNKGEVAQELEVLFENPDKKFYAPIKVGQSYYVFIVVQRWEMKQIELKEVYAQIMEALFQKDFVMRFAEWVEILKKDAVIKMVNDQPLN